MFLKGKLSTTVMKSLWFNLYNIYFNEILQKLLHRPVVERKNKMSQILSLRFLVRLIRLSEPQQRLTAN